MPERWKTIPGWEDYEVSTKGRIKRIVPKLRCARKFRKPHSHKGRVRLSSGGRSIRLHIACIMLLTFVGPPPSSYGKRKNQSLARHLDDNSSNNVIENLAWGSPKENTADAYRNKKRFLPTEEQKEQHRQRMLGRKFTPQHKAKIAASVKASWARGDRA